MSRYPNDYPADWPALSLHVKDAAGWRCVRCHHAFDDTGRPRVCDGLCDALRGFHVKRGLATPHHLDRLDGINFGVHHLDGDKANSAWWNLLAMCNSCHLSTQARVIVERPYILAHSEWFVPYVCGFYAHYYGHVAITREQAIAEPARWLSLGQPQLYEGGASVMVSAEVRGACAVDHWSGVRA